jgi:hypothetical protein
MMVSIFGSIVVARAGWWWFQGKNIVCEVVIHAPKALRSNAYSFSRHKYIPTCYAQEIHQVCSCGIGVYKTALVVLMYRLFGPLKGKYNEETFDGITILCTIGYNLI